MKISIFHRLYNSFGGHRSFSLVGDLLEFDMQDFGSAIDELEITLHFKQDGPARKTLEKQHQDFHKNLSRLPKCTFSRKKRYLSLDVEATFTTGYEIRRQRKPPIEIRPEWVNSALHVIVESLPLIGAKVNNSDDFNFTEFESFVTDKLNETPSSVEELEKIHRTMVARRKVENEKLDEWEKMGIDWKEFYPTSRDLVPFPYQWNVSDEFAPNGSDTGADTLSLFREWSQVNSNSGAFIFFTNLLQKWEIDINDPYKDDYSSHTYLQAAVGLAFASAKIRGECEDKLKEISIAAIDYYLGAISEVNDWKHKEECQEKLNQSKLTIQKMPNNRMQSDAAEPRR